MSIKEKIKALAPVGVELKAEFSTFGISMGAALCLSTIFLLRFAQAKANLYEIYGKKRILIEGAKMPTYDSLIDNCLLGFIAVMGVMIILMIYNYAYHHMNGKPIYLMRRLPDSKELHVRCLTLPMIGIIIAAITMVLMWFVYKQVYYIYTPFQCLPL